MEDLVFTENGQVVTSSLEVARCFGKQHKHVLDTIDEKIQSAENPTCFNGILSVGNYKDSRGRFQRMYLLNRDGFVFIAMGFTGKKADEFKLKYIEAFNKMEQQLKEQNLPMSLDEKIATIASGYGNMRQEIGDVKEKVEDLSERFGLPATNAAVLSHVRNGHIIHYLGGKDTKAYQKLSRKVFSEFGRDFKENFEVPRYDAIPLSQFDEALTYTKSWQPSFNTREAIRKLNLLG